MSKSLELLEYLISASVLSFASSVCMLCCKQCIGSVQ